MTQTVPAAMADTDIVKTSGNQTIAGTKTFSSQPILPQQSMVRVNTANGYGSSSTAIRRFTTTVASQGTDITYADSATLGATFTINVSGVYAVSYNDQFSTNVNMGITLNDTNLTASVTSSTASALLAGATTAGASYGAQVSWTGYLAAGSVLRANGGAGAAGANTMYPQFTIARLS